ncbi:hypothetical protein NSS64_22195 [Paenibacillus sp. FSL H8-0122]|uniref:hypothetical protein n=1 Tax=Paenibacillus sp. FSL H8-0122 TaxID=2954510 RepID=UPI0030FACD2B
MQEVSPAGQLESLQSMQSTIRKLEAALTQMTQSGASTTLVAKRLRAVNIGLAVLDKAWQLKPHSYTPADCAEAREVINGLIVSVKQSYTKAKPGSPQQTLLSRRLTAFEQVIEAMNDL